MSYTTYLGGCDAPGALQAVVQRGLGAVRGAVRSEMKYARGVREVSYGTM
jgi:hypothetical protein